MGSDWAPAVFLSIVTLTTGAVILLRPVAKRLGEFLEVLIQERRLGLETRTDMQALAKRVELLEDRVQFAEEMLTAGKPPVLTGLATPGERLVAGGEPAGRQ